MGVPPVEFIGWQTQPRPEPAERQGDAAPQGGQRSRLRRALGLLVDFLCLAVLSAGMIAVHLAWGETGANILVGVMAVVVIAITICRG